MAFVTVKWNPKTKVYALMVGELKMKFSVDKEDCEGPAKIMNLALEARVQEKVAEAVEEEREWARQLAKSLFAPVRIMEAKLLARGVVIPPPISAASEPCTDCDKDDDDE